jgi:hypothetical protein
VDDPQGPLHGGGGVAAPLFAQVAADHLAHLGIYTRPDPVRRVTVADAQVKPPPGGGTLSGSADAGRGGARPADREGGEG